MLLLLLLLLFRAGCTQHAAVLCCAVPNRPSSNLAVHLHDDHHPHGISAPPRTGNHSDVLQTTACWTSCGCWHVLGIPPLPA